jgi:hypothetical protein
MLCQQQNLPFSALATRPFLFIMAAMAAQIWATKKTVARKQKRATPSFADNGRHNHVL